MLFFINCSKITHILLKVKAFHVTGTIVIDVSIVECSCSSFLGKQLPIIFCCILNSLSIVFVQNLGIFELISGLVILLSFTLKFDKQACISWVVWSYMQFRRINWLRSLNCYYNLCSLIFRHNGSDALLACSCTKCFMLSKNKSIAFYFSLSIYNL